MAKGRLGQVEIFFYHLEQRPLEQVLPLLLEKSLARGWNSLVQVGKTISGEKSGMEKTPSSGSKRQATTLGLLDRALWTFRDDSFLPHCIYDPDARYSQNYVVDHVDYKDQPIVLCADESNIENINPNDARIRFYVAGAVPPDPANLQAGEYERLVFIFDGHDPDALITARRAWKQLSKNNDVTYWQQTADGNWVKKG